MHLGAKSERIRFAWCVIAEALPEEVMQISEGPEQLDAGGTNFGYVLKYAEGFAGVIEADHISWIE
jgi:hypothetical protein